MPSLRSSLVIFSAVPGLTAGPLLLLLGSGLLPVPPYPAVPIAGWAPFWNAVWGDYFTVPDLSFLLFLGAGKLLATLLLLSPSPSLHLLGLRLVSIPAAVAIYMCYFTIDFLQPPVIWTAANLYLMTLPLEPGGIGGGGGGKKGGKGD